MRVFRVQGTDRFECHPSWDGWVPAVPEEPAGEWPGYRWALVDVAPGHNPWRLIREEDAGRALAGEEVDVFVPGLMGCDDPAELACYVEQNVGGAKGLFVALYEGEIVERRVGDGVVFLPRKLLAAWPAETWLACLRAADWFVDEDGYEETIMPVGGLAVHARYDPFSGHGDWWVVAGERVVAETGWAPAVSRESVLAEALLAAQRLADAA